MSNFNFSFWVTDMIAANAEQRIANDQHGKPEKQKEAFAELAKYFAQRAKEIE